MIDITALNSQFETARPEDILDWAWQTFGSAVAASSSFQSQSVPLLHMISRRIPALPIFFLDTGFHFPETLAFVEELTRTFGLNLRILKAEMGHDGFRRQHGSLYHTNPDLCCYINKVEPLNKATDGLRAWISGIRRDQTDARRETPILSQRPDGLYKICPIASWTRRDVWQYIHHHNLPHHPLFAKGYMSIGCEPCTRPTGDREDERAGRWAGHMKTECGLHLDIPMTPLNEDRRP